MAKKAVHNRNTHSISLLLYSKLDSKIRKIVYSKTRSWKDRAAQDDVMQDVWEKIWKYRLSALKGGASHPGYISRIVATVLADHAESRRKNSEMKQHLRNCVAIDDIGRLPNKLPIGLNEALTEDVDQHLENADDRFSDDDIAHAGSRPKEGYSRDVLALNRRPKSALEELEESPEEREKEFERDERYVRLADFQKTMRPGVRKDVLSCAMTHGTLDRHEIMARLGCELSSVDDALSFIRKKLKSKLRAISA